MALSDFLDTAWPILRDGVNTQLFTKGATLTITKTGKMHNKVERLKITANGCKCDAEAGWNAVEDAIFVPVPGTLGVIIGTLEDYKYNDGHSFVMQRDGENLRVTVNWNYEGGGAGGGGPPEDSTD